MGSNSLQDSSATSQVATFFVQHTDREDQISLIEMLRVIAKRKGIIFSSLLASIILATVYLYVTVPKYRAEIHLLPPQERDIQELSSARRHAQVETPLYTRDGVFKEFIKNLRSYGLRKQFFEVNNLVAHYSPEDAPKGTEADRTFDTNFDENLIVRVDDRNPSSITASFVFTDPKLAAQWLNEFTAFANEQTVLQLYLDVKGAIESEIKTVRGSLDGKLRQAKELRRDRIIQLEEALQIAKALRIESVEMLPLTSNEKNKAEIEIITAEMPYYMRGVKALEAEIFALQSREAEEPFIQGLRELQQRLAILNNISINPKAISSVTIDAAANTPYRQDGRGKALVVLSAAVLGIVVGILIVFIAEYLSNAPKEE